MANDNFIIKPAINDDAENLALFTGLQFIKSLTPFIVDKDDAMEHMQENYSLKRWEYEIANPSMIHEIAFDEDNNIIGMVQGGEKFMSFENSAKGAFEMFRLYVDEKWHGTGAAFELFKKMKNFAICKNAPEIYLATWSNNFHAQKFYKRQGFEEVGKNFFDLGKAQIESLIMRLKL